MKKLYIMMTLLAVLLTGCGSSEPQSWDCTVEGRAGAVVCSSTELKSRTGTLSFQNRNLFPIVIHLYENGRERDSADLQPGAACAWQRLDKTAIYTVGLEAEDGKKAVCIAFDGTEQTPYTMKEAIK